MNYWLMKTEPDEFSIDDLAKRKTEPWGGVRNYQARNYMREMQRGDYVFFYHSSCDVPGIVGIAEVSKEGARRSVAVRQEERLLRREEQTRQSSLVDGGSEIQEEAQAQHLAD